MSGAGLSSNSRGTLNKERMCYAASVLQVLASIPLFSEALQLQCSQGQCTVQRERPRLCNALNDCLNELKDSKLSTVVDITPFMNVFREVTNGFKANHDHDASEFLGIILSIGTLQGRYPPLFCFPSTRAGRKIYLWRSGGETGV